MDLDDDFKIFEISYKFLNRIREYQVLEVEEREYRRSYPIYYSRVYRYKIFGYFFEENPFSKSDYLSSTCCFSKMDNNFNCNKCNKKSKSVFLDGRIFLSYKTCERIKKKNRLDFTEEFIRDQRIRMSNPEKQEIVTLAMHPERIEKILRLTGDNWTNITNYI